MASAASAISAFASSETISMPFTIFSLSYAIFTNPSVLSNAIALPSAVSGNLAIFRFGSEILPATAISGSENTTEGITVLSKNESFWEDSAATTPCLIALCASIGIPMTSPIARIFGSDVVELFCPYCGTKTYCLVNLTLCSNCESIISMTRSAALKKDSQLVQSLEKINSLTNADYYSEENFESAISIYDELISSKGNIGYIYAKALLLIKYSNYVLSNINYTSHGFMEENYTYSQKSMNLVSNARLLFYKLIYIAESNAKLIMTAMIAFNVILTIYMVVKFNNNITCRVPAKKRHLEK